jgi:mRNA interferase HigB
MRIISEKRLRGFWQAASGKGSRTREKVMRQWMAVVKKARWQTFSDIRGTFNHADIYGSCTIFDVGGNKYRIIAKVAFGIKVVFIRRVLTHAEYDENIWRSDCREKQQVRQA